MAGNNSAQSASVSATTSAAGSSFDFSLSNSGNLTVQAGASATDTISVTLSSGSHSRPVALSASGVPAGATASFATSRCKPNCATVLTIKTPTSTPAGSYPITVTARGNDVRRTTTFTLMVLAALGAPPPSVFDFSLANGGTMTLAPARSGVTMITATRVNGTAQPISFSATGFPTGVTSSFSQRTCAPTCYSPLSMITTATVPTGNYPITVTARSEGLARSTTFTLTITALPTPPSTDTLSPTVAIASPANSASVSGSATRVSATASDNVGVVGVQFKLDGNNLDSADSTAPYSVTWNTATATNGTHSLTAVARDAAGNSTTSSAVSVTVNNPVADATPPAVSISAPTKSATVAGSSVSVPR